MVIRATYKGPRCYACIEDGGRVTLLTNTEVVVVKQWGDAVTVEFGPSYARARRRVRTEDLRIYENQKISLDKRL